MGNNGNNDDSAFWDSQSHLQMVIMFQLAKELSSLEAKRWNLVPNSILEAGTLVC